MDLSLLMNLSGVQYAYLLIVIFLFVLAVIDLWVGVSNDAVNFLGSAVGSRAAKLKHIMIVAAVGVFVGAAFSNGMMDVARNGIFNPSEFTFNDVMIIFLAVMVSDVFLLDLFNSLGLPTSTTVSMVFELLGASCITAILSSGGGLDSLNTSKAMEIVISIFLSVAIAFIFGLVVQWLSRLLFTFRYRKNLSRKIGLYGGFATTAIVYFMLVKGMKKSTIIKSLPEGIYDFIYEDTTFFLLCTFVFFTLLMQVLHYFKVNVLKVIVMLGTFSLAMAFAGNDLVNFIGVTLAGADSFSAFIEGGGDVSMKMHVLNESAGTSSYFLIIAGVIMVVALWRGKKARRVLQTSIDLSTQQKEENELFGTSSFARNLVRATTKFSTSVVNRTPDCVKNWVNKRFAPLEEREDVAFDLVRASVNLVLAGLLIAFGTSLKLPLSTTYVTFMVGMGTSLADRAWGRESAVYRVTGVVSVIGGWFITAGAAFMLAALVGAIMYFGGLLAMFAMIVIVAYLLYRNSVKSKRKGEDEKENANRIVMLTSENKDEVWGALKVHTAETLSQSLSFSADTYALLFNSFAKDSLRPLRGSMNKIVESKELLKKNRRIETGAMQRMDQQLAFERSTWYHLCTNSCQQMLNTLTRIGEPVRDHLAHSFSPLPKKYIDEFSPYCKEVHQVLVDINAIISSGDYSASGEVSERAKLLKHKLAALRKEQTLRLHKNVESLRVEFVYLNMIQESHELLSEVRNLLRGCNKYFG